MLWQKKTLFFIIAFLNSNNNYFSLPASTVPTLVFVCISSFLWHNNVSFYQWHPLLLPFNIAFKSHTTILESLFLQWNSLSTATEVSVFFLMRAPAQELWQSPQGGHAPPLCALYKKVQYRYHGHLNLQDALQFTCHPSIHIQLSQLPTWSEQPHPYNNLLTTISMPSTRSPILAGLKANNIWVVVTAKNVFVWHCKSVFAFLQNANVCCTKHVDVYACFLHVLHCNLVTFDGTWMCLK